MKRLLLLACLATTPAQAQDSAQLAKVSQQLESLTKSMLELQKLVGAQNQRISALEKENLSLRESAETSKVSTAPIAAVAPVAQSSNPSRSLAAYLPDIGLVGDIVGTLSKNGDDNLDGNDRISVRELELTIGHDIDAYSRFDATIAFSDSEDTEVEEAFVTYWGLPEDTKMRIGRMRPRIGLASPMHRDALETVDEPLVIQNYLGVEGLSKTGIEFSNYLPLPWDTVTHEVILGMVEGGTGEDGTMFGTDLSRQTYYGRLKNFWEISSMNNLQLGGTYMVGSSNSEATADVHALGTDLVFNHHFNSIQKLTVKSEALFQSRSQGLESEDDSASTEFRHHPWGMYSLAEYRMAQQWAFGGRWDYVQPVALQDDGMRSSDVGWSAFLTFYQSEFARWRFQYEHVNYSDQASDDIFFLQGTFAIGTHKHSLQ